MAKEKYKITVDDLQAGSEHCRGFREVMNWLCFCSVLSALLICVLVYRIVKPQTPTFFVSTSNGVVTPIKEISLKTDKKASSVINSKKGA